MKKVILKFLLPAVIGLGFFSCQREQVIPESEAKSALQLRDEVVNLTQAYLASTEASTHRGGPPSGKLGADLKGAIRGFLDGYELSFGPHGPSVTVHGLGGALLGGIAASQAFAGINPGSGGGHGTPHPGNEFDRIGTLHYTLMDEIYANSGTYFHPNGQVNYPAYHEFVLGQLVAEGILAEGDRPSFPVADWEAKHPAFLGNESVQAYSNGLNHPQFLPVERSILGQYFGALMASQDVNGFSTYSINMEDAITSSTLGAKSKALLLVVMATARHGAAYWN